MSDYELYEKVITACKANDENAFIAAARNWVQGAQDAPFENDEAQDLFNLAKMHCASWRNKTISGRVSKIRMVNEVRKIAEMDLPNPYLKVYPPEQNEKESIYIFGVLPEESAKSEHNKTAVENMNEGEKPHFSGKRDKK